MLLAAGLVSVIGLNSSELKSKDTKTKQCGVSDAQIISYLQNHPHNHTVYTVRDITGTCNSLARVENCVDATVYVDGGTITGHLDNNANCPN